MAKRGRPRALPVLDHSITDHEAFWRLKHVGFHSYQAMRIMAFVVLWQRTGGTVAAMLENEGPSRLSRATIFNRLRDCHKAGFEPELVAMSREHADNWLFLEYSRVEHIKAASDIHAKLPWLLRKLTDVEPQPEPDDDIDMEGPRDPKGWLPDQLV